MAEKFNLNQLAVDKKFLKTEIKKFWQKYEFRTILILGFILVATISFEAGILKGRKIPKNPLIIEKPVEIQAVDNSTSQNASEAQNSLPEAKKDQNNIDIPLNCAYVGSKNSNKFHLPTCQYAKNIKPENQVCFSSPEDAAAKGYLSDKNCIK
ncbi:hypothetical protein KKF29_02225 [Patescibacteria group bacterium]|nr:hypothetical protein [Patescibacteria group bacterium]